MKIIVSLTISLLFLVSTFSAFAKEKTFSNGCTRSCEPSKKGESGEWTTLPNGNSTCSGTAGPLTCDRVPVTTGPRHFSATTIFDTKSGEALPVKKADAKSVLVTSPTPSPKATATKKKSDR